MEEPGIPKRRVAQLKTSNAISLDDEHCRHEILAGRGHKLFQFSKVEHTSASTRKFTNGLNSVCLCEMNVLCYIRSHPGDLFTNYSPTQHMQCMLSSPELTTSEFGRSKTTM